jgi:hypothetical protein
MFEKLLMLAQEAADQGVPVPLPSTDPEPPVSFWSSWTWRLIAIGGIFAVLILYKLYRDRAMK